ncbi:hypothetical protein AHAS_Ahas14G0169000 [Arachis hypogaea]
MVHKLDPSPTWNLMVENYLCSTEFYHVSRRGDKRILFLISCSGGKVDARNHTFVLPVREVTVTLEDVAHIFGLSIDGEPERMPCIAPVPRQTLPPAEIPVAMRHSVVIEDLNEI